MQENPALMESIMTALGFAPVLRLGRKRMPARAGLGAISRLPGGQCGWWACRGGDRTHAAHAAHADIRTTVEVVARDGFLAEIRTLLQTVPRRDMTDADETAFVLYVTGFYRWARKGTEAVQIPTCGDEKLPYTVLVAVTAALAKLTIRVIVSGKPSRAERSLGPVAKEFGILITARRDG